MWFAILIYLIFYLGRHKCKNLCCFNHNPCIEVCNKVLSCLRHKCSRICHSGPCDPCQMKYSVTCTCGSTQIKDVSCGTHIQQFHPYSNKPTNLISDFPSSNLLSNSITFNCNKPCLIASKCSHTNAHLCHPSKCPSCQELCSKEQPCGHFCQQICHQFNDHTLEVTCPPCQIFINKLCHGGHLSKPFVCGSQFEFSCDSKCLKLLSCGIHFCNEICHFGDCNSCSCCLNDDALNFSLIKVDDALILKNLEVNPSSVSASESYIECSNNSIAAFDVEDYSKIDAILSNDNIAASTISVVAISNDLDVTPNFISTNSNDISFAAQSLKNIEISDNNFLNNISIIKKESDNKFKSELIIENRPIISLIEDSKIVPLKTLPFYIYFIPPFILLLISLYFKLM